MGPPEALQDATFWGGRVKREGLALPPAPWGRALRIASLCLDHTAPAGDVCVWLQAGTGPPCILCTLSIERRPQHAPGLLLAGPTLAQVRLYTSGAPATVHASGYWLPVHCEADAAASDPMDRWLLPGLKARRPLPDSGDEAEEDDDEEDEDFELAEGDVPAEEEEEEEDVDDEEEEDSDWEADDSEEAESEIDDPEEEEDGEEEGDEVVEEAPSGPRAAKGKVRHPGHNPPPPDVASSSSQLPAPSAAAAAPPPKAMKDGRSPPQASPASAQSPPAASTPQPRQEARPPQMAPPRPAVKEEPRESKVKLEAAEVAAADGSGVLVPTQAAIDALYGNQWLCSRCTTLNGGGRMKCNRCFKLRSSSDYTAGKKIAAPPRSPHPAGPKPESKGRPVPEPHRSSDESSISSTAAAVGPPQKAKRRRL